MYKHNRKPYRAAVIAEMEDGRLLVDFQWPKDPKAENDPGGNKNSVVSREYFEANYHKA